MHREYESTIGSHCQQDGQSRVPIVTCLNSILSKNLPLEICTQILPVSTCPIGQFKKDMHPLQSLKACVVAFPPQIFLSCLTLPTLGFLIGAMRANLEANWESKRTNSNSNNACRRCPLMYTMRWYSLKLTHR